MSFTAVNNSHSPPAPPTADPPAPPSHPTPAAPDPTPAPDPPAKQIKRRRMDPPCTWCRNNHKTCDRARTCNNCSRRGLLCTYPEPQAKRRYNTEKRAVRKAVARHQEVVEFQRKRAVAQFGSVALTLSDEQLLHFAQGGNPFEAPPPPQVQGPVLPLPLPPAGVMMALPPGVPPPPGAVLVMAPPADRANSVPAVQGGQGVSPLARSTSLPSADSGGSPAAHVGQGETVDLTGGDEGRMGNPIAVDQGALAIDEEASRKDTMDIVRNLAAQYIVPAGIEAEGATAADNRTEEREDGGQAGEKGNENEVPAEGE